MTDHNPNDELVVELAESPEDEALPEVLDEVPVEVPEADWLEAHTTVGAEAADDEDHPRP